MHVYGELDITLGTSIFWAYKFIFMSPSSVNKVVKATRLGNAQIHGMTQVTKASISYITTQVCSLIPIDSALVM